MKRFVGFTFMILFGIMFLANVVSACVDLSDPSTWDGHITHAGSYLIHDSITLCSGSVTISDPLVIDNDGVVVDGTGAEITVSNEILVLLANHKDVVIKNLKLIRDYNGTSNFCVELHDDENITLENVTVYSDTPCRLGADRVNNSVIENIILHNDITHPSPRVYTCVHMFDNNNITLDHSTINSSLFCTMSIENFKNSTIKNNIFRNAMLSADDSLNGRRITEYNLIYNNTFYQDIWGAEPQGRSHAIRANYYPEATYGKFSFNHNIIAYNRFYNYSSDEIYLDFAANNHIVCNEFVDNRPAGAGECDDAIDVNYHTSNLTIEYNVINLSTPNDEEYSGGLRGGFLQYEQQLNTGENNTIQFNTIYYDSGNETSSFGVLDLLGPTNELNFYKNKFFIIHGRLFQTPPNLYNSTFVDNIICTTVTQTVDPTVRFVNNTCDNGPAYGCVRDCSELTPEDYEPYACPIVIHEDDTITINGTVEINPGQPVLRTLDDLYCVADISEIADDVVTVNWYRNGVFYRSETVVCDDHPGEPYQHCTSGFVPNADTLKHDEWTCEVIATVSGHPTSFNTSRIIENTPPQPPVLVTPIGGITVESPVDFDWDDAYDPDVLEGTDSLVYEIDVSGPTSFHETGLTSTSRSNVALSAGWYEWHVKACDDEAVCSGWSDTETFVIRDTEPNEPQFNVHKSYDKRCAVVGEPVTITLYYNRTVNTHHPTDLLFLVDHSGSMPRIDRYQANLTRTSFGLTRVEYTAELEESGELYLTYLTPELPASVRNIEIVSPSGDVYSLSDGTLNCSPFDPDDILSYQCRVSYTRFEPGEWTFRIYHDPSPVWYPPRIYVSQSVEKIKRNLKEIMSHLDPEHDRVGYISFGGPEVVEREIGPFDPSSDAEVIDNMFFPLSRTTNFTSAFPFARDYLAAHRTDNNQIIIFVSDGVIEDYENLTSIEESVRGLAEDGVQVMSVQPFTGSSRDVNREFLINVSEWGDGDFYDLTAPGETSRLLNDIFGYHDVPPVINVTVEDGLIDNVTLDESSLPSECYTIGNVIYCPQGTVEEGDEGWVSFVVYPTEPGINITLNTDPSGINLTGDYEGFIEFNQPVITVCPPGYHCSEDGTGCVRDVIHLHTDEVLNATVKPNPAYTNDTLRCYVNVNVTDPEGADLHIRWMVAEPIDPLGLHRAPYEHRPEYDQVIHVNPGVHLVVSGPVDHLKKHERWMCIPYFVMVPLEGPTADVLNRPPGPVTEFLPDVSGYTCGRNWTVAWMPGDDPDGDEIVGYRVYFGNETDQTWVGDTSYPTYTFENLVPGERYCYYVKETDGEAWSNTSVKHCIDVVDCRCPYVDNVTLNPEVTTVGHEITCRAHVTDPRLSGIILPSSKAGKLTKVRFGGHDDWLDGDVPVSPPTTSPYTYSYRITWYHNGRLLGYDELTDVNTLEPEASVPIYEPGEVTCEVCVLCDPDSPLGPMGCEYQGCMNGTAEVVDIPVKTVEVTPDPAYTREDLLCDIELNESTTRTITVEWWVNGMKVKEYSEFVCLNGHCNVTLNHSYTRKHDLVTCVARSSYGAVNDTAHVINTPPTPPMPVHPRPGEITLNDWMDGRFISNDDDEDPLMYYVYGGTSPDPSRMVLLGNVGYYPYDDREGMYNWTGLTPGKYYMYAVAYDGEDYSEDGLVTMFVVRPITNVSVEVTADGGIRDYPETYDTVRCTARIDEDTVSEWPVNVHFVWYRNGTVYTEEDVTCDGPVCEWATVITPDENDKFDNWTCEAIVCTDTSGSPYPDDPVSYVCDSANDSVVLQNIPPDTPTLITPHDHAVIMMDEEPIRFEVQGTDPDDTRLEYHVILMDESGGVIDTVVDEGEGGITFDHTLPVGTYRWKTRSYDRYNWSGWSDEWTFTVVTVPQVKVQIESDNDGVDPNMFETTDDLICKGNVSGVTEEHTVTVVWYRDDEVYSTTEATCLSTGSGGYECKSDLISNDDTVKHQVWRCVMNVCNTINGEDYCSSDSDEEEIQNLPPSVPDLVTPDDYKVIKTTKLPETNYPNLDYLTVDGEPYEEEDIKLDVTDSFDYDYDPLTYTFVGTDGSGREFVNEDTDVSEMNIGMLDSGDYTWWVNVTDGETVVTSEHWHFSVDINHPPFIQAQVVPTTIHSGDYVRCDMDWLWDEDNDDVNVTFYLVNVTDPDHPVVYEGGTFFLNSSDPDTYSNDEYYGGRFHDTVGNYTHAHDVLSTGVGPVHKGESWRCVIYANDSRIVTRWTSPIVRVVNTPPTPPVIWHRDTLHSYEELYWNKSVDVDGDPITYYVYGRRADEDEFTLLTVVTPSDGVRDTYEYDWSISETGLYQWYVVATDGEAETQSIVAEEIDLPNPRHIDEFVYMIGKGTCPDTRSDGTQDEHVKPVGPKPLPVRPEPVKPIQGSVKPKPVSDHLPSEPIRPKPVNPPSPQDNTHGSYVIVNGKTEPVIPDKQTETVWVSSTVSGSAGPIVCCPSR